MLRSPPIRSLNSIGHRRSGGGPSLGQLRAQSVELGKAKERSAKAEKYRNLARKYRKLMWATSIFRGKQRRQYEKLANEAAKKYRQIMKGERKAAKAAKKEAKAQMTAANRNAVLEDGGEGEGEGEEAAVEAAEERGLSPSPSGLPTWLPWLAGAALLVTGVVVVSRS